MKSVQATQRWMAYGLMNDALDRDHCWTKDQVIDDLLDQGHGTQRICTFVDQLGTAVATILPKHRAFLMQNAQHPNFIYMHGHSRFNTGNYSFGWFHMDKERCMFVTCDNPDLLGLAPDVAQKEYFHAATITHCTSTNDCPNWVEPKNHNNYGTLPDGTTNSGPLGRAWGEGASKLESIFRDYPIMPS